MGRDVLQIVKDINQVSPKGPKWNLKGFIGDYGQDIKALTKGEFDIIGTVEEWQPSENEVFVCAVITPGTKERVVKKLKDRGAEFIQLIHPTVSVNDYCNIGEGAVLYPYVFLGANFKLDNFVAIHPAVYIGHDVQVGDYTTVNGLSSILGCVQLGKRVFIGYNVTIIPDKIVGDDAFIGAGSVVLRNVKEGTKVFGNPARKLDL